MKRIEFLSKILNPRFKILNKIIANQLTGSYMMGTLVVKRLKDLFGRVIFQKDIFKGLYYKM